MAKRRYEAEGNGCLFAILEPFLDILRQDLEMFASIADFATRPVESIKEWIDDLQRPRVQAISRPEARLVSLVEQIYGYEKIREHYEPSWLIGPGSGQMHVDVAVPDKKLAFEYQGEQHDQVIAPWGGSRGLYERRERDAEKKYILEQRGWRLIEFWYDERMSLHLLQQKIADSA